MVPSLFVGIRLCVGERRLGLSGPDQTSAIIANHFGMRIQKGFFHICKIGVVEIKLTLH